MRVVGLFAGIGGIELGMHAAAHRTELLCEVMPSARAVLADRFPDVPLVGDVREIVELPPAEIVCAGFPCQDLSQAGRTAGIRGRNSGLVSEVFRLVDGTSLDWLVLENVPFMLQLDRGQAMSYLTGELSTRGFAWAYRVVDSRSFGLPQRRKRVLVVASRRHDPREVLFADDVGPPVDPPHEDVACGFYWTEGIRGLGWAVDAIPTLKGGSTIGIPSPPAIRLPGGEGIVLPEIRDAERLQGFDAGWTEAAGELGRRRGDRWKLVGNAVSVPMSSWLGRRLASPGRYTAGNEQRVGERWPKAAWGADGNAFEVEISQWPERAPRLHLAEFLIHPTQPLSERAARGFLGRAARGSLRFPDGLLDDVAAHLERQVDAVAA